jgi:ATP-dependent exoDNAse (exonuclease V) beta subunit
LVHAWLEHIEWLENGVPDEATLRRTAAPLADPRVELTEELARFEQLLVRPASIAALSKSSYHDPATLGLPGKIATEIAAGLKSGAVRMELYREWPFAVRLDDAIVQGFVDRLLLYYRGDTVNADSAVAADILDCKTDRIESAGTSEDASAIADRVEFYRPQLEAYRRAVAEVFRLDPRKIAARLLFVEPGVIVGVEGSKE